MKKFLIILTGLLTGAISIGITPRAKHIREMDYKIPTEKLIRAQLYSRRSL